MLISPLALYNYDNDVFSLLKPCVPTGVSADDIINNIILNTAELEVLYPNPGAFKYFVGVWAKSRINAWKKVYTALTAEYSPIENTDRYEDITDTTKVKTTDNTTDKRSGRTSVTGSDSITFNEGNRSTTESVTGFNADTFKNNAKTETNHATDTTEGTNTATTEATNTNDIDRTETEERTYTHINHTHGNIGVTTNQKMITEEIELRINNDITKFIVDDFKKNFCLMVY